MSETEEKLARELGFRVCCGFVEYPDQPSKSYAPANGDLEKLWRKCLELTEQREKELHSANCLDAALDQLHEEEGEQRERGGGSLSADEWLQRHLGKKISDAAVKATPWWIERMDDYAEAYASSRLAALKEKK